MSEIRLSKKIGPAFYGVARDVFRHSHTHYDESGGRGSLKSSYVSLIVPLLLLQNPGTHALVLRKVANTIRDSVYAQYMWAIGELGMAEYWDAKVSPMELIYKPTGQKIMFRGADDPMKIKSIKVPFGYIAITHFEEKDQFAGRAEIRTILQSTMRGGSKFWNFESYNPPISRDNWANKDMQGATRYGLDGMDMYFPMNGAFDPSQAQMIVGDWSQLVYAIRQDMTFKIFTEGVIQDPTTKAITYNLMQNDMVALRAVMRLGWEIANPVNAYNVDIPNPFPFSVYGKAGTVSTVTVSPATATVAKGESKAFSATVAGDGIVSENVEWSQNGAKSSISEDGVLTVASNETSTSITVTAKSKQDSAKTGTATVTVGS